MDAPPPNFHHFEATDVVARSKIDGLGKEFHEFRAEVKADVGALRNELGNGLNKIFTRMDSDARANASSSKSGLGLIASFSLGVVGLAFSFTTLITQPLRDADQRRQIETAKLADRDVQQLLENGAVQAKLGTLDLMAERNRELSLRIVDIQKENAAINYEQGARAARLEGMVEALRSHAADRP